MTPEQIIQACKELAAKIGPAADVSIGMNNRHGLSGYIYTTGITGDRKDPQSFSVGAYNASSFEDCLEQLEAEWRKEKDKRADRTLEEMALEIIRLTAEFGECTDAGLRAKFGPLVAEMSEAAVSRANEMAANGPFKIVAMRGANAA